MYLKQLKRLFLAACLLGMAPSVHADPLPLDAFAMLPVIQQISVSPDGRHMGVMRARDKNGDYIVEIYDTNNLKKKPVRLGAEKMEITGFRWANNERLLIRFRQNVKAGADNYWAFRWVVMDADGKGKWLDLPKTSEVRIINMLPDRPDEILIGYDSNDSHFDDVIRFNVKTGRTVTMMRGSDKMSGFFTDADGEVRGAAGFDLGKKAIKYYARSKGSSAWKLIKTVESDSETRDEYNILGFSNTNPDEVYVQANNGEDKAGIYTLNIQTGKYSDRMFGLKSVDANDIILSDKPKDRGRLLGFVYATDNFKRYFLDPSEDALYKAVEGLFPGKLVSLRSRSDNDREIVVYTSSDKDPGTFYLLRDKTKLEYLGNEFPLLTPTVLPRRSFTHFTARDGMDIPAYITTPTSGKAPWPAVVVPHGGPWVRDSGGYDEFTAVLAANGYIVIQPEYRGSTGFGLAHWKAGDAKWGHEMQDDVDDAAEYLVKEGLADKNRLAIFGWSYGGYSAFVGSMRANNIYKCSIAGAGVSDLDRMDAKLNDNLFLRDLQRPTIKGLSPLDHVDQVNVPILVIHGAIDHTVPVSHSRDFVEKLKKLGKDYRYVELEGADHHMNEWSLQNKRDIYGNLLDWLQNHCS